MLRSKALLQSGQGYAAKYHSEKNKQINRLAKIRLTPQYKEDLHWQVHYLDQWNGKTILKPNPDSLITTDASQTGWETIYRDVTTQGQCSLEESQKHINVLELKAVKSFAVNLSDIYVHLRTEQH